MGGEQGPGSRGGFCGRVASRQLDVAAGDPSTWMAVSSEDTFQPEGMDQTLPLECGGTLDLGESYPGSRSASQFRANLFWVPGGTWGLAMAVVVSPTRR